MALDWFKRSSRPAKVILLLIVLYAISTIVVLAGALIMMSAVHRVFLNPYYTLAYAIISFGITILISTYHLSTMIRRRKRKTDYIESPASRDA